MATKNESKRKAWESIYRLIKEHKKGLLTIFAISLLSTSVTLVEPLVYREAINDIAGLFVQKARNDVRNEAGLDEETDQTPIVSFIEKEISSNDTTNADEANNDSIPDTDTVDVANSVASSAASGTLAPTEHKQRVREPHRKNHVAPRTPHEAMETLIWAVVILFLIKIIGIVLWWIGDNLDVKLACTIERGFIRKTFGHVLKLPLAFFARRSSAALHNHIDQSEEISGVVSTLTKEIFPEIVSLVGILAIMFWQNATLTLIAISVIPIYLVLAIRSTKQLETNLTPYYEKWDEVSARMQDALGGIKTVKLSGAEERETKRLDQQAGEAYASYLKRSFLANKYAFWEAFLTHVASASVLVYGGYLALHHQLSPGDVVMFVAYIEMLYDPIDNLSSIWASVQQNVKSIDRAYKLLDTDLEEEKGDELVISKGNIEFDKVVFGYKPEKTILKGLSIKAKPGKLTALVGSSGAGKTTAVDLILKLFEPQSGKILIDDQPISKALGASIRRQVGMVAADGSIFRGTLLDNIRYKNPEATEKEAYDAAVAAGMQKTLERLPEGMNTIVGESGFGLSVGERQRIQIARIIVSKPKILILDEATANLDYATEMEVRKTVDSLRKTCTVIVIAHRYSMVKDADYVYVLDNGEVLEEGTPKKLLKEEGWFYDFANTDEEEEEEETEDEEELEDEDPEDEQ